MMLRSPSYLAFVRSQPCCAPSCSSPADHAHHFGKRHGGGGTGVKPHDSFAVPLCQMHHSLVHRNGMLAVYDALETEALFYRVALQLSTKFWIAKAAVRQPGRALEVF